jgi:hypothetical protein
VLPKRNVEGGRVVGSEKCEGRRISHTNSFSVGVYAGTDEVLLGGEVQLLYIIAFLSACFDGPEHGAAHEATEAPGLATLAGWATALRCLARGMRWQTVNQSTLGK